METTLRQLNGGYVRAAETSDVRWYAENLAEDFLASNPDGSLIDRETFLARMAQPYPGSNLKAVDVNIRILGEVALIHAGFRYDKPGGGSGTGRYTDVWARRQGRWLCVSAHFNRF
jgi:ketosteroid isomerase-like protein